MDFKLWLENERESQNKDLQALTSQLKQQYPGLSLFVTRGINDIHIHEIKLPKELRGQGIGSQVIRAIQNYAIKINIPITLSPEAERGYKAKLIQFYQSLGFRHNKGRNKDYSLGGIGSQIMVWRPRWN